MATNSQALVPAGLPVPERFANPLRQVQGALAQPAVRRSLPMVLLIGLIAAAGLAWMMLATPSQRVLFQGLADADKAAVTASLTQAGIASHIDDATGNVTVDEDKYSRARMLLASQNLPHAAPGGYAILDQLPMGVSRAVEGERLRQARESELAQSIGEIDAVADARVHLAMPEQSVFVRDQASPSASVIVRLQPGRALSDAQVSSIVNLVASSVPGMRPDAVTIVDQTGGLLTHAAGGDTAATASNARLQFEHQVEDRYRQQLLQLLTPLVGADNFSTEVQADVDMSQVQATRERYDPQGTVRAEQSTVTSVPGSTAPGGIPGALSNTPPPPSAVQSPTPQPTPSPGALAPVQGSTAPGAAAAATQNSDVTRQYDTGREVSVTQSAPGGIRRLSVAVVLRDPETGRPRNAAEIQQLTDLVRATVGADQSRNDQVVVVSRRFAPTEATAPAWYDNAWLPMIARNVTAVVIALLVLLLGVRPLAKSLIRKKEEASPDRLALGRPVVGEDGEVRTDAPPVSIDALAGASGYDNRIDAVRGFTRDNPARAALAVRDMIKS